jgi:hypothetical protein
LIEDGGWYEMGGWRFSPFFGEKFPINIDPLRLKGPLDY